MARKRVVPKSCIIHRIVLEKGGAEVGYRCADDRGQGQHPLLYPLTRRRAGYGTYPAKWLKGIHSVSVNGATVSGTNARVGFELAPRSAVCWRDRGELECEVADRGKRKR